MEGICVRVLMIDLNVGLYLSATGVSHPSVVVTTSCIASFASPYTGQKSPNGSKSLRDKERRERLVNKRLS